MSTAVSPPRIAAATRAFRNSVREGPPAIVSAALIWGTNGLAASFLPAGTAAPTVAAARLLVGGVLLLALCRIGRLRALLARRTTVFPLAVAAGAMAAYQACYFAALDLAGVTVGSAVAMASVPVFAGLIAAISGRGGTSLKWLAATTLAILGGVVLALARPDGRPVTGGILYALAAGASYAVFTVASSAVIRRGCESRTTMAVVFLAAGLALGPTLLVFPAGWLLTVGGLAVVGYLAGVSTVGAYLLYGRGLRTTGPATASTLTLAEPACAAVIGVLVLREPMTTQSVTGLLILVVALLVLTVPARRPAPAQQAPPVRIPVQRTAASSATRRTRNGPAMRRRRPRRRPARRRRTPM